MSLITPWLCSLCFCSTFAFKSLDFFEFNTGSNFINNFSISPNAVSSVSLSIRSSYMSSLYSLIDFIYCSLIGILSPFASIALGSIFQPYNIACAFNFSKPPA